MRNEKGVMDRFRSLGNNTGIGSEIQNEKTPLTKQDQRRHYRAYNVTCKTVSDIAYFAKKVPDTFLTPWGTTGPRMGRVSNDLLHGSSLNSTDIA